MPHRYRAQAVARILAARVLGDNATERRPLEMAEQVPRSTLTPPLPSKALLRSSVERDYAKMNKEVTRGAKKHWTWASRRCRSWSKDGLDRLVIEVSAKDVYTTSAYIDAVFARLAMQDGGTVTHDDFWFPLGLVSATRGPAPLR